MTIQRAPSGQGLDVQTRATTMLALPVRVDDILVGHTVDLVLDADRQRVLGFEVRCGDGEHRFLPYAAAAVGDGAIGARTPFALLDGGELDFYARRGSKLRDMRGTRVSSAGRPRGALVDLEVAPDGAVGNVLVSSEGGERRSIDRSGVVLREDAG